MHALAQCCGVHAMLPALHVGHASTACHCAGRNPSILAQCSCVHAMLPALHVGHASIVCHCAGRNPVYVHEHSPAVLHAPLLTLLVGHVSTACQHSGRNPVILQVEAKVKELEALNLPVKVNQDLLTGSTWTTLYTTSTGIPFGSCSHSINQRAT